jgi:hypothetical protein
MLNHNSKDSRQRRVSLLGRKLTVITDIGSLLSTDCSPIDYRLTSACSRRRQSRTADAERQLRSFPPH